MNKKILIALAATIVSLQVNAKSISKMQDSTSTTSFNDILSGDNSGVTSGVRLSIIKNLSLKSKVKASFEGESVSESDSVDQDIGIAIGYAQIPVQNIGFNTALAYSMLEQDVNALRLQANGTYGINQNLFLQGGLNLNRLSGLEGMSTSTGIGFQVGVGAQINRNFGFDLNYVSTNNPAKVDGFEFVDVDLKLNGIELGLNASF